MFVSSALVYYDSVFLFVLIVMCVCLCFCVWSKIEALSLRAITDVNSKSRKTLNFSRRHKRFTLFCMYMADTYCRDRDYSYLVLYFV